MFLGLFLLYTNDNLYGIMSVFNKSNIQVLKLRTIFRMLIYLIVLLADDRRVRVSVVVFIAIFNNISLIFWRSVLFVEETGVLGENRRPAASH